MKESENSLIITHTQNWLKNIVVAFNFCPFVKREILRNSIYYAVCRFVETAHCLEAMHKELLRLDDHVDIETTLVVFPETFHNFEEYLGFVDICQAFIRQQGYEGIYQLATFHPDYCFADAAVHDPANYTNRSPYPLIHIIREESLERVLEIYEDPESIPEKNIILAREQGTEILHKLLLNCFVVK